MSFPLFLRVILFCSRIVVCSLFASRTSANTCAWSFIISELPFVLGAVKTVLCTEQWPLHVGFILIAYACRVYYFYGVPSYNKQTYMFAAYNTTLNDWFFSWYLWFEVSEEDVQVQIPYAQSLALPLATLQEMYLFAEDAEHPHQWCSSAISRCFSFVKKFWFSL